MSKFVNHRFGIDVFRKGQYMGTNYIDVPIDGEDETIMRMSGYKGERMPAENVLADAYALVYEKANEQEEKCFKDHGYPYLDIGYFEEYSLKIFV